MHHNMYIRAILPVLRGGTTGIIQMAVPGYDIDESGALAMDDRRCQDAIAELRHHKTHHYVCLTTFDEIGKDETDDMREFITQTGITPHHLPVDDYAKPNQAFLTEWKTLSPKLHSSLDKGGSVVLQCLAGYGRSGTIAAMLMIERGIDADTAIKTVRGVNGESIESAQQQNFLLSYTPA